MTDHDLTIQTEDGPVIVSITALSEDATDHADDVAETLRDAYEVDE